MKISDVAERTHVVPRLIRYYEQQGLLTPGRSPNGYRTYGEADVDQVARIAGLVQAGIPTRLVKVLLDAETANAQDAPTCPSAVAELLAAELKGLDARIACLTRSRDTISSYLTRTQHEVLLRAGAS